jgi:hypothetical protein
MQPDILHAVAVVFLNNMWPFTSNITAAKKVHHYFESTANFWLCLSGNDTGMDIDHWLIVYWESDWDTDTADCNSQGGLVSLVSIVAIVWYSRIRPLITISILKAKFNAYWESSR